MPLRINDYIKAFCINTTTLKEEEDKVLEKIGIIFVLMKEKNVFEKHYRRELINRILGNFGFYSLAKEEKIIQLM